MVNGWKKWRGKGITIMAAMGLLMSACSGGTEEPPAAAGTPTPGASTPPAKAAADVKGEVYWQYLNSSWSEQALNKMVADFNKTYPNVKVRFKVGALEPMIASGDIPNVATNGRLEVGWILDGMFEDLNAYIKKDPDWKAESFNKVVYEMPQYEKGQYGIPMYLNPTYAMIYNNKILNQYGEKVPDLKGLKDSDEFYKKFWVMKNGELEMMGENPLFYYGNLSGLFYVSYLNGADPKTFWDPDTKKLTSTIPKS
ncbi:hypothetical protein N6H14_28635 [Paenibacillus sp. CC-CFT747]|nr:hypothetical protein N6H14_28635 [Paenibacillus sp. CC-CFT747]